MSTFLALKYAAPKPLPQKAFHAITKARLLTMYPHSGIVKDGMLMHSNLANGLHKEPFEPAGWHLLPIPEQPWQNDLFDRLEGTPYDVFSLLAFAQPFDARDSSRLYCYEWSWLYMTGENPRSRITPEMLMLMQMKLTQGYPT